MDNINHLSPDSLGALRLPGSPAIAPSRGSSPASDLERDALPPAAAGSGTLAVVQEIRDGRYLHRLHRWPASAGDPVTIDSRPEDQGDDLAPTWSPSGRRFAFISNRDGVRGLRLCEAGSERSATVEGLDGWVVRSFVWIDERRLAVVVEAPANPDADPQVIDWLRYKRDGRKTPLDVPASIAVLELGQPARIVARAPGAVTAIAALGERLAYVTSSTRTDRVEDGSQLRLVDLTTGADALCWDCPAPIEAVAGAAPAEVTAPDTSPSTGTTPGRAATLVAISRGPHPSYAPRRLWAIDCDDPQPEPRRIFPGLDASIEYSVIADARPSTPGRQLAVGGDRHVCVVANIGGDLRLLRGHLDDRAPTALTPAGACVTDFAVTGADVAVCLERPQAPAELFRVVGTELVPLSDLNDGWAGSNPPARPATMTASTPDGLRLTSWLYLPERPGPHPLFVRVHGGPHLCSGNGFSLETQILVAAGFAVLTPNVRGSDGWGEELRAGSVGQWGAADFEDLTACVDQALTEYPLDPDRLYIGGGSYGGYLTNWTIAHTDRFRAAISERSICNLLSKYGTSDNGFDTNRTEMGGADLFDDSVQTLVARSPLRHAASVSTPVLLIHGESDQRCPIEQSEQWFAALRRLGQEAILVRYPGESHNYTLAGTPAHRIDRLQRILDWLDGHR